MTRLSFILRECCSGLNQLTTGTIHSRTNCFSFEANNTGKCRQEASNNRTTSLPTVTHSYVCSVIIIVVDFNMTSNGNVCSPCQMFIHPSLLFSGYRLSQPHIYCCTTQYDFSWMSSQMCCTNVLELLAARLLCIQSCGLSPVRTPYQSYHIHLAFTIPKQQQQPQQTRAYLMCLVLSMMMTIVLLVLMRHQHHRHYCKDAVTHKHCIIFI
jgi:hypothetical protein